MKTYKIIVIGDSNVGKTCLTYRFCSGHFPGTTEATIGVDFREKRLTLAGDDIVLQLWDTAGQERFRRSMVQHYYRNVHAVVLVYDMTRTSSFQSLRGWVSECERQGLGSSIPRLVVGNKCDDTEHITVSTTIAQRFADQHNMPLFETSAKTDSECDHIESIFLTLAHKLKASRPMMPPNMGDDSDESTIAEAMDEMHRSETTAALLDSGLVDIRSGDFSSDPNYTGRQEPGSWCC
uniref:Ras-related protein Rab-33 n=2 Tax=Hirondellea gigas TaxID=1518452 RepID=A0A6A7G3N9_9CRUS